MISKLFKIFLTFAVLFTVFACQKQSDAPPSTDDVVKSAPIKDAVLVVNETDGDIKCSCYDKDTPILSVYPKGTAIVVSPHCSKVSH